MSGMLWGMIGCGRILALLALPFGALMALAMPDATIPQQIAIGLMPSGMAFVAGILLAMRDHLSMTMKFRKIRRKLFKRNDISESDYLAQFPVVDPTLICQTRQAVSEYFGVPIEKIHPTDKLRDDLMFDAFTPDFHYFVFHRVLAARHLEPIPSQMFSFNTANLSDVGDLANEVQRVMESLRY